MKIPVIELSECIICGICEEVCPSVFMLNESGYISLTELTEYPESEVDEAIKNCPADCISWDNS
ncbi:MAG: ferredoxin [Desulfobacterales bacterium]|nr:ferredoxin [Desulfobacterales bacterium]